MLLILMMATAQADDIQLRGKYGSWWSEYDYGYYLVEVALRPDGTWFVREYDGCELVEFDFPSWSLDPSGLLTLQESYSEYLGVVGSGRVFAFHEDEGYDYVVTDFYALHKPRKAPYFEPALRGVRPSGGSIEVELYDDGTCRFADYETCRASIPRCDWAWTDGLPQLELDDGRVYTPSWGGPPGCFLLDEGSGPFDVCVF